MEGATTFLLTQGVLGVAVIVLGAVILRLYNKTERLEKEKIELLEARRTEEVAMMKSITEVLSDNAQNMRILSEKIEVGKQIERLQQ